MKLYYAIDPVGNFGDDLNPWLWPRLIPEILDEDDSCLFVGIGTILDRRIPAAPRKVVFGTGTGYAPRPVIDDRWKIYCVRGPLSAAAMGLPRERAITDSAMLVCDVFTPGRSDATQVAFIPHHGTALRAVGQGIDLQTLCDEAGVVYVDPTGDVENILGQIRASKLVIAEAMHGAIVADALRVPWTPVRIYGHTLDFKWHDWCRSLTLTYEPQSLLLSSSPNPGHSLRAFLQGIVQGGRPQLSRGDVFNQTLGRMREELAKLREDALKLAANGPRPQLAEARGSIGQGRVRSSEAEQAEYRRWWKEIQLAAQEIRATIPQGEAFILVDDGAFGGEFDGTHRAMPFVERNGICWGPPADDASAVQELERQRSKGARFVVFIADTVWWLEYYQELARYMRSRFRWMLQNERLTIVDLGKP